ncbi:DUF6542 domain-containing protein [Corynebacterium lizhenjunii]|uniref:DUF6542 domain-containing protein n=1 Tax=Corynebacterium lizhenjunii TaxID=2709394 RepID=UPI0013EBC5E1|nr:DUF6542 domain-containing protein [Corynebacterium lizhenjunii]
MKTASACGLYAFFLSLGLVIALFSQHMSWGFAICFALGALGATFLVNLRGLFLTVASIPPLFAVFALFGGWALIASGAVGGSMWSLTTLAASAYPLAELFPPLLIVTLACALLAVVRLWHAKKVTQNLRERETATRRATAVAERRNRDSASKARRLTVAELSARNREELSARKRGERAASAKRGERAASAKPARRRLDEDLYGGH